MYWPYTYEIIIPYSVGHDPDTGFSYSGINMKHKKLKSTLRTASLGLLLCTTCTAANASFTLDWDKVEHWAGEGTNRCALVVQFNNPADPYAHVWGFRWNSEDYEDGMPSGEDMFRAVASQCEDLLLFTQYTGWMGSTVCGIGYYDPSKVKLTDHISFDFASAQTDSKISFNYFVPNTSMNQDTAPGNFTPIYCKRAITAAAQSHIIDHPINAREYGYPAYDYDHWVCDVEGQKPPVSQWNAGWYDGYWSFWIGGPDLSRLSFSGSGITATSVNDGNVIAFNFKRSDPDNPFGDISSNDWGELDYLHDFDAAGVETTSAEPSGKTTRILTLSGIEVGNDPTRFPAGVYIMVDESGKATKTLIR